MTTATTTKTTIKPIIVSTATTTKAPPTTAKLPPTTTKSISIITTTTAKSTTTTKPLSIGTTTKKTTTMKPVDNLAMPGDNTPGDVAIDNESLDFGDLYDDSIDIVADPVPGVLDDPKMYFDQITTTTVSPMLYDYLFSFGKPTKIRDKPIKKKFNAQSLRDAYSQIMKTADSARERRSHKRVSRQTPEEFADPRQFNPFSTLARPWVQPRKVIGILDKRAPPEFRFNNFVLISLPVFSVASTGSIGKRCLFPE